MDIKSNRNYGLDFLRILSMLGIIGLHVIDAGGMLSSAMGVNKISAVVIHRMMRCSVDVFAMLSGYLYISRKRISSVAIIKLLVTVAFYCVTITALFLCFAPGWFVTDKFLIVKSLFPPIDGRFWYITSYVFMFFMIPYINTLVNSISEETYKRVLGLQFVLLSCFTTFGVKDYFAIANGYSPFWLIFCYMTGGYIKLYGNIFRFSKLKKAMCLVLNIFIILFLELATKKILHISVYFSYYTSPFIFINALLLLEIFAEINMKRIPVKTVLSLSNAAFGVYIIHSHILVYDNIITDSLGHIGSINPVYWLLTAFSVITAIYILCWVIDVIRSLVFKAVSVDKLSVKLSIMIDKILMWDQEK